MESIISTFHIDWKIIVAQAINFVIVFVILYLYALKPLSKLMKERGEKIAKGIDDAKTNAEILDKSRKEYEDILVKARAEANVVFQIGVKEAENKKNEMLEKAKGEVGTMIEAGKKTLETEKVKMVEEAKTEIVSLAMQATEKLIKSKQDLNNL
ncbi:F0F1 ATP synthase subunit B [Patescibacteria group bacterium]|nr:F0F1 ATP synthase subunit B [Patescibacteria group bacterium]